MIYISLVAIIFLTDCVEWYFLPKTEIKVFSKKWIYVVLVGDHRYNYNGTIAIFTNRLYFLTNNTVRHCMLLYRCI